MTSVGRIGVLTRTDLEVAAKDGEQLLLTLILPVVLLGFFSNVDVIDNDTVHSVTGMPRSSIDFLTPGIITLALLSVSFVRLAIGLGFDRGFGAIKRLAVTPLSASEFFISKVLSTVILFVSQLAVLVGLALLLGWDPDFHIAVVVAVCLGLVTFCGLAVLLSSVVDGLRSLALANTLYVLLLLLSGLVFDLDQLPGWLSTIAKLLPSTGVAAIMRAGFDGATGPGWAWVSLIAWTVVGPLAAVRAFRWE